MTNAVDIFIIMGVSGCGKSTVGAALAKKLQRVFIEGDTFHPVSNIEKMQAGNPLTDHDRAAWLNALCTEINRCRAKKHQVVATCSALKKNYRDQLRQCHGRVQFIHLQGSKETILNRIANRKCHFMPTSLLDSQFDTLEIFTDEHDLQSVNINNDVATLVTSLAAQYSTANTSPAL